MPIWNPQAETMSRDEMSQLQLQRLRQIAEYVQRVPFYKKAFAEKGVNPADIKSLEDLSKLPFTTKQDLRDQYPFGLFATSTDEVVRIHASSGTTGKPTVGAYTRNDIKLWAEVMARTVSAASVTARDVAHNAYGYGLFTGGLGFHLGFETVGATTTPMSGGLTQRQLMLMEDFGATVLGCTPSYSIAMAEEAENSGIDFKKRMKLRVGIFGAEPWTEEMRREIENRLGIEAFDIYGLTEIIGPGVSVECESHTGLHINEDYFLPEVIDPDTGETLAYGQEGELVFTTLTKEAQPVIRYRTRDRTILHGDKCACGRTLVRMEKVRGRTDDMLIIRGVNVFPSLIESALLNVEGLEPYYQIFVDRPKDQLDKLEIQVEANRKYFEPVDMDKLEALQKRAEHMLLDTLGVSAEVKLMGPGSIERSIGKAVRVVDKRNLYKQ
ncbi:MAG: Phenylacetate-coenzyme A ligase [Anaerolineales bacterium]|nr:Phenylacetate-coenzyme A ligase [Anaerolineales bacterium]